MQFFLQKLNKWLNKKTASQKSVTKKKWSKIENVNQKSNVLFSLIAFTKYFLHCDHLQYILFMDFNSIQFFLQRQFCAC